MEAPRRPPNRPLLAAPEPVRTAPAWDAVRAAPAVSAAFGPLDSPLDSPRVQDLVSKLERINLLADSLGALHTGSPAL